MRNPNETLRNRVGVPFAERAITDALAVHARALFPPRSGRSLYLLREVEIGIGRPDLLLLVASPRRVEARREAGLRLGNLTEAEILGAARNDYSSRHTLSHRRAVLARLADRGWVSGQKTVRIPLGPVVADSLIIEAKVADWGRGIVQLSRSRWLSHRAALAISATLNHRVRRTALRANGLGLLLLAGDEPRWQVAAPRRSLSVGADLWLTELLIRSGERIT